MPREHLGLEQLLADPLIRQVMSSDAVDPAYIRGLALRVRAKRQAERPTTARPDRRDCGPVAEARA
jgi:hypothetical protein